MSLQGIPVPANQMFPGAVVEDLRDYAAKLGLPADWHKRITAQKHDANPADFTGALWVFRYEGKPLVSYQLDLLSEIQSVDRKLPLPPPVDPLVVATELALSQPKDPRWRRFNDCVFCVDEIAAIDGKIVRDGKPRFRVILKSGKEFEGPNEANYANSGMSTFEFFLEHVMGLKPAKAQ